MSIFQIKLDKLELQSITFFYMLLHIKSEHNSHLNHFPEIIYKYYTPDLTYLTATMRTT